MLTKEQNRRVTLVEDDAPLGRLLRETYWLPFSRTQALKTGAPPTRVRLVGEDYVAFRAEDGRIGFFDEGCPHRGVSMALARVEGCALRCIFHGWKIDVSGKLLEVPTEGARSASVAERMRVPHYPTVEAGGLIWVFLGKGEPPAFPDLPFFGKRDDQLWMTRTLVPTNWLQGLEAALDSSHVGFLHRSWTASDDQAERLAIVPDYDVEPTSYGMRAAAIRRSADGSALLRVSQYFAPFITLTPGSLTSEGREGSVFMAVPVDDLNHLLFWGLYNKTAPVGDQSGFFMREATFDPDDYACFDGDRSNNWGQDRAAMAHGHFSGFTKRLLQEDVVVQISMGRIANRTRERLTHTDMAVHRCRLVLLDLLDRYEAGEPIDGSLPDVSSATWPFGAVIPEGFDWRDAR
jgi:phthalate 4,5-dioxygenase oxygenase subunit